MSDYKFGWIDPRGLSYLSSDADRKAMDAKIAKEYDELFKPVVKELSVNPFLNKVVKMEYVGSRVTCDPAPTYTDEDVLLLTDDIETLIGDCIEVGFVRDGDHKASYPKEFVSLRSGELNFIVTDNEEFYNKFMLATHVCKSLNVMSKINRITVFQAILYNNKD
jgi:hypothetical protein